MPCTSIWAFGYGCALFIAVMGPSHGVVVQQDEGTLYWGKVYHSTTAVTDDGALTAEKLYCNCISQVQ
jgi:hypothetical protein